MLTVLVCGGRTYANRTYLFAVLDALHARHPIGRLVQGGAGKMDDEGHVLYGADLLAREWGLTHIGESNVKTYPADWRLYGQAAGPIRNQKMLDCERPGLIVAFEGRVGTADMVTRGRQAKVPIFPAPPGVRAPDDLLRDLPALRS